jgi:hypothetical protein
MGRYINKEGADRLLLQWFFLILNDLLIIISSIQFGERILLFNSESYKKNHNSIKSILALVYQPYHSETILKLASNKYADWIYQDPEKLN